ncbi:hypothetical protein MPSEU_000323400 [Mayamaea pseudoterrestris]|nr:hypothetical protein MPSEU_000323400 [Mayamaea pseudoterrestris]
MCLPNGKEVDEKDPEALPATSTADDDEESDELNKAKFTDDNEEDAPSSPGCSCKRVVSFYWTYEFLILAVIAILLARAYPPLGAIYLAPQITSTWIAVFIIFLLSGLNLKTEEFKNALKQIYFNVYVQVYSFAVVSSVVFGISRALAKASVISQDLADGMVICACLPMTINMVIVFTRAAEGDEAASIFNASFGNLIGAFVSPALILGYLGRQGNLDLLDVFYKLAMRVLLPIAIGQILRNLFTRVKELVKKYKAYVGRIQQYCLIFVIYTTFCKTFMEGMGASIGSIFIVIVFQFLLLTTLMAGSWYSLQLLFRDQPRLRVMGFFGCTQKTVAVGVPLIGAMFEDSPAVGLYTLPLIIWYTMQLVIGTALVPRLVAFVRNEEVRLGINQDSDDADSPETPKESEEVQVETDEEKGEAGFDPAPAALPVVPEYNVAMPWIQQTFSGEHDSEGVNTDTDGVENLSFSELDALSVASSGPRELVIDTDDDDEAETASIQVDLDDSVSDQPVEKLLTSPDE